MENKSKVTDSYLTEDAKNIYNELLGNAGGTGDGDSLAVIFTKHTSQTSGSPYQTITYSCNKTYQEVADAFSNKKMVYGILDFDDYSSYPAIVYCGKCYSGYFIDSKPIKFFPFVTFNIIFSRGNNGEVTGVTQIASQVFLLCSNGDIILKNGKTW